MISGLVGTFVISSSLSSFLYLRCFNSRPLRHGSEQLSVRRGDVPTDVREFQLQQRRGSDEMERYQADQVVHQAEFVRVYAFQSQHGERKCGQFSAFNFLGLEYVRHTDAKS